MLGCIPIASGSLSPASVRTRIHPFLRRPGGFRAFWLSAGQTALGLRSMGGCFPSIFLSAGVLPLQSSKILIFLDRCLLWWKACQPFPRADCMVFVMAFPISWMSTGQMMSLRMAWPSKSRLMLIPTGHHWPDGATMSADALCRQATVRRILCRPVFVMDCRRAFSGSGHSRTAWRAFSSHQSA